MAAVRAARPGRHPPAARRWGQQSILDWFGCVLAGTGEPLARIVRDELGGGSGPASLVGTGARVPEQMAALVNGATGHALDYDDTNNVGGLHTAAPTVPAALAVAETEGMSGADLLAAVVIGVEIGCRYGIAMGLPHYQKGWHSTSSIGVFAATAAASWLLRLDEERFGYAMGLAASMSAGVQANFATMAKPFHAGWAAQSGVVAARLGRRGYVANADAFEATAGLADAAGTGEVDRERLDLVRDEWLVTRTLFKYHAACHGTHAAIESTRALMAGRDAADVRSVRITVHPNIARVCKVAYPATGLQAKFSLRAATAMTILGDDTTSPATFSDERVGRADLRELMRRIDVVEDATAVNPTSTLVRLQTARDSVEAGHDIGIPATDVVAQERHLRAKFQALAGPVIGERSASLADQLLDLAGVARAGQLLR
ncbi:MmgE/PrpD family protein [Phytohabitans flavus]|uniref:MmgE/PrpD family protein n=1 Tax=Phytohabitans flavus TaxID=1076124 RepID=UPI003624EFF7